MECDSTYLCSLDIVGIIGIIVNIAIAIIFGIFINKKFANNQYLKDFFIKEVLSLRNDYESFFNKMYSGRAKPKDIVPFLKLTNIKIKSLINILDSVYGIKKEYFDGYRSDLKFLIDDMDEYRNSYKENIYMNLSTESTNKLMKYQQDNIHDFYEVIKDINKR